MNKVSNELLERDIINSGKNDNKNSFPILERNNIVFEEKIKNMDNEIKNLKETNDSLKKENKQLKEFLEPSKLIISQNADLGNNVDTNISNIINRGNNNNDNFIEIIRKIRK